MLENPAITLEGILIELAAGQGGILPFVPNPVGRILTDQVVSVQQRKLSAMPLYPLPIQGAPDSKRLHFPAGKAMGAGIIPAAKSYAIHGSCHIGQVIDACRRSGQPAAGGDLRLAAQTEGQFVKITVFLQPVTTIGIIAVCLQPVLSPGEAATRLEIQAPVTLVVSAHGNPGFRTGRGFPAQKINRPSDGVAA